MPEDHAWTVDPTTKDLRKKSYKGYIVWIKNVKSLVATKARTNQAKYDKARKAKYDKKVTSVPLYKVGDLVRYYIYDANKLSPHWSDKHRILQFFDDHVVQIENIDTKKLRTVNIDHIKLATHTHIPQLQSIPISTDVSKPIRVQISTDTVPKLIRRHSPKLQVQVPTHKPQMNIPIMIQNNPLSLPDLSQIGQKRPNITVKISNKRQRRD